MGLDRRISHSAIALWAGLHSLNTPDITTHELGDFY
jgi:hypothetical protein